MELPRLPEPSPQMLVGAASPLWAYFGAATAGGVAYWWMTRWTQPANLEAFFGARTAFDAALEPVADAVSETLPEAPVGGEAAPISPVVETAAETPPEPTFEATADPLPEPIAKPRVRKPPTSNGLEA